MADNDDAIAQEAAKLKATENRLASSLARFQKVDNDDGDRKFSAREMVLYIKQQLLNQPGQAVLKRIQGNFEDLKNPAKSADARADIQSFIDELPNSIASALLKNKSEATTEALLAKSAAKDIALEQQDRATEAANREAVARQLGGLANGALANAPRLQALRSQNATAQQADPNAESKARVADLRNKLAAYYTPNIDENGKMKEPIEPEQLAAALDDKPIPPSPRKGRDGR